MESRQIVWFAPECSEEELARMDLLNADEEGEIKKSSDETDEDADNAFRRLDNVDWCLSCEDCQIMQTLSCPPRRPPNPSSIS